MQTVKRSGSVILRGESKRLKLSDGAKLTPAGKYYFKKQGVEWTGGFDPERPLKREGGKEFVVYRDGTQRLARTLRGGDFSYTRIGKQYFKARGEHEEFIVSIPVKIQGRGRNGRRYERFGHLPHMAISGLASLKVPVYLSEQEKHEQLKKQVLDGADANNLLEVSNESYSLHDGEWKVSKLTTKKAEDGELVTEAVLDRPLQAVQPKHYSHLPHPDLFHPSALEESSNCVCHQLASQLEIAEAAIRDEMDELQMELYDGTDVFEGHWSKQGVTAQMLIAYCKKVGASVHIMYGSTLLQSVVGAGKSFVATIWGHHLYSYDAKGKHSIAHMQPRALTGRREEILARPAKPTSAVELDKFGCLEDVVHEGMWWTTKDRMPEMLQALIHAGKVPKVKMSDFVTIRQLEAPGLLVRALPADWSDMQNFGAQLHFLGKKIPEYRGQGLPGYTVECLQALLKAGRSELNLPREGVCENCGTDALLEKDHVVPCSLGGTKGQWLCSQCHREKTLLEDNSNRHARGQSLQPMTSFFCRETYETLHKSHPIQVVERVNKPTRKRGVLVDVQKCRANALTSIAFPVFSALDDPKAFEAKDLEEADFFWVDLAKKNLPFTGRRWYHRCCVTYGLQKKKINLGHLKYSLTASGHLPQNAFHEPVELIRKAWALAGQPDKAKIAINSAIGMCGSRDNATYSAVLSDNREDSNLLSGQVTEQQCGDVHMWTCKTKLVQNWSLYPVYHICLDYERLRLAQIVDLALEWGAAPTDIIEFRTDSVLIQKNLAAKFRQVRMCDLGFEGTALAHHVQQITIGDPPACCNFMSECEPPNVNYHWQTVVENGDASEVAKGIVDRGESIGLFGPPGTGKSHLCNSLVEMLREKGEKVHCCALTHSAARNINGCTLQSWLHRYVLHGAFTQGWLYIDEVSLVSTSIWNYIALCTLANAKFILSGDMEQMPPPCNVWCGKQIENAFGSSRLMHTLAGGNLVQLTTCRRQSDPFLFNFYTALVPGGSLFSVPLDQCIQMARKMWPCKPGHCEKNLCISHQKRQRLSMECYKAFASGPRLHVDLADELLGEIYVGCPLIGCVTSKGIVNGVEYTVIGWDENVHLLDADTLERLDVKLAVLKQCRYAFAITYCSSQGKTYRMRCRLHDTAHKNFTRKTLYMALGRVSQSDYLEVT